MIKRYSVTLEPDAWFLPRDAMQAWHTPSFGVRLSVRLSVTFVHSVKTSNHIFIFLPLGSQTILVFFRMKRHGNILMGTA